MLFVRQFNAVLASIPLTNGVNTDGCPVQASRLVTGRICLATDGILPVQDGNSALVGADLDLPSTRKPSALTEFPLALILTPSSLSPQSGLGQNTGYKISFVNFVPFAARNLHGLCEPGVRQLAHRTSA